MKFSKLCSLMSIHRAAIFAALFMGFVTIVPQLIFMYKAGDEYRGVYIFRTDAELHYLARMNSTLESSSPVNPFLYENESGTPIPMYYFAEAILTIPARIFDVSVPTLNLFYKFLLPAIISLLVYSLTFRLLRNRLWSVASMFVTVLGPTLLSLPDVIHFFKWDEAYGQFTLYSRPINPQFSSILFFTYLHSLLSAIRTKRIEWFIVLGILFGLSFYAYFYSFTFLLALNVVCIIIYLLKKDFIISKKLFATMVLGISVGMASIINTYQVYTHPYYSELAKISDIALSHAPVISLAGVMTVILFICVWRKLSSNPDKPYLLALILTTFVVVNQQILTGIILQEGHYHWYFNVPIHILIVMVSLYYVLNERFKKTAIFLTIALCIASLTNSILIQWSTYKLSFSQSIQQNAFVPILDWLNKNTPKDSVVLANNTISSFIPVYTNNNVVWEDHAGFYLMTEDRRKFTTEFVLSSFTDKEVRNRYRIDYVIWDTVKDPHWKLDGYQFLKEVFRSNTFILYDYQG